MNIVGDFCVLLSMVLWVRTNVFLTVILEMSIEHDSNVEDQFYQAKCEYSSNDFISSLQSSAWML